MNKFINIYKQIIKESEGDQDLENSIPEEDKDYSSKTSEFKFTDNLASEFTQRLNEFTATCAKMIKDRNVSSDLYKEFEAGYKGIKNIIDACKNN